MEKRKYDPSKAYYAKITKEGFIESGELDTEWYTQGFGPSLTTESSFFLTNRFYGISHIGVTQYKKVINIDKAEGLFYFSRYEDEVIDIGYDLLRDAMREELTADLLVAKDRYDKARSLLVDYDQNMVK
jgi:hypothetical protein